jgi:hypothetical protein
MSQRRESLMVAAQQVSPALKAKWHNAFNEFDLDKSGVINASELAAVMTSLKMAPAPGEVEAMIEAVDSNQDKVIDLGEFEMMMVAAGRGLGHGGAALGFSHVVDCFIRKAEIAKLVETECTAFLQVFFKTHSHKFMDLPPGDIGNVEQTPAWFDTFKMFQEEAELTMQNLLMLWGVTSTKHFDQDFLEALGANTNLLDDFLALTDYPNFVRRMQQLKACGGSDEHPALMTPRPTTPCQNQTMEKQLAAIDQKLAQLDSQRNALLAQRRRLVGFEVQPVTTMALRQELESQRWKDEVGFD